jgi:hypothetical protein
MRGVIPASRMEEIQAGLPRSVTLRDGHAWLADVFAAPYSGIDEMAARVRLNHGWHMLNQARLALVEAEACRIFYEEVEPNPTEALYRCQYYLDDAALRLHASCEHMLRGIEKRWSLPVKKEKRERLLVSVLRAVQQSPLAGVRGAVAKLLQRLRSSQAWKNCMNHRDDWVHNRLPAVAGLNPQIIFDRTDIESAFPPQVREALRKAGYPVTGAVKRMSLATGPAGELPPSTIRSAYLELFAAYDTLLRVMD